jgi:hypothetical protein
MKSMRERDVEYTPWFRALGLFEQDYWWQCENKRIEAKELVHQLALEQHRLRQRGQRRHHRNIEKLAVPLHGRAS